MFNVPTLPDKLYDVVVPDIATYTDEDLKLRGLVLNYDMYGKPIYSTYENYVNVMLPLTKIIDIYIKGYEIRIVKEADVTEIYNFLESYLIDSTEAADNPFSIHPTMPKDKRLFDIEKFAAEVFGINKTTIVKSSVDMSSGFDLGLGNISYVTPQQSKQHMAKDPNKTEVVKVSPVDVTGPVDYQYVYGNVPSFDIDPQKVQREPIIKTRFGLPQQ